MDTRYNARYLIGELESGKNLKNADGITPLHLAALCGQFEIVQMMIQEGEDKYVIL